VRGYATILKFEDRQVQRIVAYYMQKPTRNHHWSQILLEHLGILEDSLWNNRRYQASEAEFGGTPAACECYF
jgi:hypothetical protein